MRQTSAYAYEIGFTEAWGGLRNALWHDRPPENEAAVAGLLEFDTVKAAYLHGSKIPELISPDNWNSDFFTTLQRPNARRVQLDLFYNYRTNVTLYPKCRRSLGNGSQTRSFSGDRTTSFLREKVGKPSSRVWPRRRCIGLTPATSRWRTAWSTSPRTFIAFIER